MAAIPTRGLKMYISRNDSGPAPSPIPIDVTAVAASNPAVLTASADDVSRLYDGMELTISGASLAKLNGIWPVTKLSSTTFSIPVDTSGDDTAAVTMTATIPGQPSNAVAFTSITNAATPLVTVPDASEIENGDIVAFDSTGVGELDNAAYVVASKSGNTFTLEGADLSDQPSVVTSGTMLLYKIVTTEGTGAALLEACGNSFDYTQDQGTTIDVSTTCGSASLAGEPGTGTISLGGYIDPDSLGFKEIQKASVDGAPRIFLLVFPNDNGAIIFPEITVNAFSFSVALNSAVAFTAGAVVNQPPVYAY
jgi:hypothetical protein